MNKNVRIAKQLIKIAKSLVADSQDEELDVTESTRNFITHFLQKVFIPLKLQGSSNAKCKYYYFNEIAILNFLDLSIDVNTMSDKFKRDLNLFTAIDYMKQHKIKELDEKSKNDIDTIIEEKLKELKRCIGFTFAMKENNSKLEMTIHEYYYDSNNRKSPSKQFVTEYSLADGTSVKQMQDWVIKGFSESGITF